jgi:hypothetical protein
MALTNTSGFPPSFCSQEKEHPLLGTATRTYDTFEDALAGLYGEPWADGLPIVPPTEVAVERFIAAGNRDGDEVLGTLSQRERSLTVGQAAVCAVMAGCLPEYFPVLLATWDALFDERFNLHSVLSSSGGAAIAAVVSGPYANEIGMNSGSGLLSPGNRANATIGRAVRIGAMAALGALPGGLDASSFGSAGKFTYHFAEGTPYAPWLPVRQQLGYSADVTTVTTMPANVPRQVCFAANGDPQALIRTFAEALRDRSLSITGRGGCYMIVLGPEHANLLADAGISQRQFAELLSSMSMVDVEELYRLGWPASRYKPDSDGKVVTVQPNYILTISAGGFGAGWSLVIPSWARTGEFLPCTRVVATPGSELAPHRSAVDSDRPDFG